MTSLAANLPPEILSTIFKMVQQDANREDLRDAVGPDSRSFTKWTRVLRVCRHWRDVGFSAPLLWTTIFVMPQCRGIMPMFTSQLCLQRSAACPLTVFIDSWADPKVIFEVLQQLYRVQELIFDAQTNGLSTLPLIWARPGPALEVLTFLGDRRAPPNPVPKLFSRALPHLPALALSRYTSFTTYSLPALRHLHIHRCNMSAVQSFESLLVFLQNVPALEDLKFTRPVFRAVATPTHSHPYQRVALPCLLRLSFVGGGEFIRTLLRRLQIPPGVSLTFPWEQPFQFEEGLDIFPSDNTELRNIQDLRNFEMRFSTDNTTTLRAVGDSSALFARWQRAGPGKLFSRIFEPPEKVWLHLCEGHDEPPVDVRTMALREFLLYAQSLKVLSIVGGGRPLVDELRTILRSLNTRRGIELPCRRLGELRISVPRTTYNYETIRCVLAKRHEAGCELQMLRLYEPPPVGYSSRLVGRATLDPKFFACLEEKGIKIVIARGDIPEMEWVDICSSQSGGPWDWPVWTRDGGCSNGRNSGFLR